MRLFDDCGGYVDLVAEIALTTATGTYALWDVATFDDALATFGPDETFVDVSDFVQGFSTTRNFSRGLQSWSAGSLSLLLDNMDGRFSPDNLTGPYAVLGVSGVRPGCAVRISMTYDAITYPIFYGYIRSWEEKWIGHYGAREGYAGVEVTAVDVWGRLAKASGSPVVSVGAGETMGPRISRILNNAGFTGAKDLDVGSIPLQATDLSDKPIDEINITADSEGGSVWAGADGSIIARDRYSIVEDPRSITPWIVFSDQSAVGAIPWGDISTSPLDDEMLVNDATYSRSGGVEQTYSDPFSIAIYGRCEDPNAKTDLVCQNDADVMTLAQWAVITRKDPEARIERLSVRPRCNLQVMAPLFLGIDLRDLIEVHCRPPSDTGHEFIRFCHVAGISFDVSNNDWTVELDLASATAYRAYASSHWGEDSSDTTAAKWGADASDVNAARWFA